MKKANGNVVVLQMGGDEQAAPWNQEMFQSNAPLVEATQTESFYIASKGEAVVGLVSETENDRPIVAALVANWIAAGYAVTQSNRKDMLRKLRIIPKKEEAAAVDQTDSNNAPTVAVAVAADTGSQAAAPVAATAEKPVVVDAAVQAQVAGVVAQAEAGVATATAAGADTAPASASAPAVAVAVAGDAPDDF